ncbi:serendipity locus protein H-1-like [Pectinophora gossypiella]|uniref:C2H2-type domain-containing protein n=1 Tax=Pectinophora gossypiella TaxID=13191 RepID=A0A1E1WNN8_PECGO|nr:serendipity locus protein H-1-like [Pectinophora gossypiella]
MNKKPGRTGPRIRITRPVCKAKKVDNISTTPVAIVDERKYIYHCQYCRLKFTQNSHFFRHMTSNHELQQKQAVYQCNNCQMVFNKKNELDLHCQTQHQEKSKLKCECCAITFKSVYCLRRHKLMKQSLQDNACLKCQKKFTNENWLEKHVRNKHKIKYRSYQCDFCALKYKYKESLLIHLKRIHKRL